MKKWEEVQKEIESLSQEEKDVIKLIAQLTEHRLKSGLTQRDLRDETGIEQNRICDIENQKTMPTLLTFNKLLRPLGYKLTISKIKE